MSRAVAVPIRHASRKCPLRIMENHGHIAQGHDLENLTISGTESVNCALQDVLLSLASGKVYSTGKYFTKLFVFRQRTKYGPTVVFVNKRFCRNY